MAWWRDWRERRFRARQDDAWLREVAAMNVRLGQRNPALLLSQTEEIVNRLAELVVAWEREWWSLTDEQENRRRDNDYLDEVIASGEQPEEYLRVSVELRLIGHRLCQQGGLPWMEAVAERTFDVKRVSIRTVSLYWDGIAGWQY